MFAPLQDGRAQGPKPGAPLHEPAPGSAERKAILDALRIPVARMLHGPVAFRVTHLKVARFHAFVIAVPRRPDGSAIDYDGTIWDEKVRRQEFKDELVAILRGKDARWKVIWFEIGNIDPPWGDWAKRYSAPEAIFPEIKPRSPFD